MLSLSFTISKIFSIEICMTLTFRMGQGQRPEVKCKYANQNPINYFVLDGNSNVFTSYTYFQNIQVEMYMTLTF